MSLQQLMGRWPWAGSGSWRPALPTRALRQYFAYHGVWAVGVRVLRQWSIRRKILTVLALMGLPLVPMTVALVLQQAQLVAQAEQQLLGAEVADAADALHDELRELQGAVDERQPTDVQSAAARLGQLAAAVAEARHSQPSLTTVWEAAEPTMRRAIDPDGLSAPARSEAIRDGLLAVGTLRSAAVDASGVTLSRQRSLSHRATLGFATAPAIMLELSLLHRDLLRTESRPAGAAAEPGPAAEALRRVARLELLTEQMAESVVGLAGDSDPAPEAALVSMRHLVAALQGGPADRRHAALEVSAMHDLQVLRESMVTRVIGQVRDDLETAERLRAWLYAGLTLSMLLSLYLVYAFFLVMRGGLQVLHEQMRRMAQGDLTVRPVPLGGDEVADTMRAMSTSMERLSDLLSSVRVGVGSVSQAAQQVAAGNGDLRTRSKRAAETLQGVVEGVTRYTRQLEACGRQVEQVVTAIQALRLESARNREQMERLTASMTELRQRSHAIVDSVRLIDSVAFRTNILALNASVEASKAGEAGRGFAVVAQEVRSLALRSAEAARCITEIVSGSAQHIEHSGVLAEATGRSIADSDGHVDRIHHAMVDVASLTRSGEHESTAILEQVRELREATDNNLSLVEQLATASLSLRAQGERLTLKIGQFKLN